jgi:hypothetical protein
LSDYGNGLKDNGSTARTRISLSNPVPCCPMIPQTCNENRKSNAQHGIQMPNLKSVIRPIGCGEDFEHAIAISPSIDPI